ncbi:probable methyltransferase-like protein 24 isoform X1 [Haliotis rubra]|uniref:probable methyltransferase-like protein 24 isoform X1 n=1 Tax=Haliotis rubra TaxID=36100 RepID=UPI001EE5C36D|nr:probable methyltransferase-like protein 24 isoform X1 [Haliotis rubra]XP_046554050.1 probable methyltransferase-like protein 24 isoform X1 [Haliotis rubra]
MTSKERIAGFIVGVGCAATFLLIYSPLQQVTDRKDGPNEHNTVSNVVVMPSMQRKSDWKLNAERNVDGPLKELRQQGQIVLPEKDAIAKMTVSQAFKTYHSYLDNVDTMCYRKLRMGKLGDGGWEICDDANYRPVKPCIVYSFGISNDFSFDDDTAKNYECNVFSFDPSMTQASYQRSPRVRFFKSGLGGKDQKSNSWDLQTLTTIKKMLNHTGKYIDVLKMDIENSEWPSLPNMVSSGELSNVGQFLVEYHGPCSNLNDCVSKLKILKDVHDAGFRKFYVHKNHNCGLTNALFPVIRTFCYEIHYVNIKLK